MHLHLLSVVNLSCVCCLEAQGHPSINPTYEQQLHPTNQSVPLSLSLCLQNSTAAVRYPFPRIAKKTKNRKKEIRRNTKRYVPCIFFFTRPPYPTYPHAHAHAHAHTHSAKRK
ncbi:hypothetical protein ACJBU6_02974 [Exserohilum turcicum]